MLPYQRRKGPMRIEQLQLFYQKGDFDSAKFESLENVEIFKSIGKSVYDAFEQFVRYPLVEFDLTTRSNMLNNLVVNSIQRNCETERFLFYPTLTSTRRSLAILDNQYILFFKKSPVSNVKTNQDDLIKNQELDKHVIFVVYTVDEFWSSVKKLELQYFSSPTVISYTFDITDYLKPGDDSIRLVQPVDDPSPIKPIIKIKENDITKRNAQ